MEAGRYGVLDETGRVVIRAVWDGIQNSYDGFIPVKKNGDWGIIDVYNNQVVKCQYKKLILVMEVISRYIVGTVAFNN